VVQDDGIGFPCFYNMESGQIVYEDPRFVYEVDDDLAAQRRFVMQELRIAVYFCQHMWEKYTSAVSMNDKRQVAKAELEIRNSPKPVHLSSFLIRARVLYKQTSVVDKPVDKVVLEELEYANWLAERMATVTDVTEHKLMVRRDHKRQVVEKLTANSGARVFCQHCKRETKRHLEFCPTCGKPQVLFDSVGMIENSSTVSSKVKSVSTKGK
jgi:RNA polymerase subunit RPABC4/transcription elongation factor Spt4